MTPIDIRPDHLRIVRDVLHRHLPAGVKVWVFGSRASWTTKDSSDLDLALDGETEIPRRSLSELETAFEDSDLPYTVDVVDLKRIGERFRRIVTKQRTPLPESERPRSADGMGIAPPAIDVTAAARRTVLALLERHLPNTTVWAYGSRVKWTSRSASDLDLAAFARPEQSARVAELREAFDESDLPFSVDLFVWDEISDSFRKRIETEHAILAEETPCAIEGWPTATLGDCIEINNSTYAPRDSWPFINYLDTGSVTENRIAGIQHLVVGKDEIPSRARRKVLPGDIVYSTVRPDQKHFGLLKSVPENFLASTGFSVIRGKTGLACTDFIYWFLAQDRVVEQLQTIAEHSASAYPSIKSTDIERLTLNLPPLPEQRAIARVLGALDDRIELNRRMNATLEAMARALFQSWFVDFDPVRAKMAGRDPGLPKEIADLFPDRLVPSELGKIPEGWTVNPLGEEVHTVKGRSYKSRELIASETALVTLKSFSLGGGYRPGGLKPFNGRYSQDQVVLDGEVVISCTDVTQAGAVIGRPAIVQASTMYKTLVASLDMFIVRPCRNDGLTTSFLYCLACTNNFREHTYALATGTTVLHLDKNAIPSFSFARPPQELIRLFDDAARPLLESIRKSLRCTDSLAILRDVLLPKLVSGDVKIGKKPAHGGEK